MAEPRVLKLTSPANSDPVIYTWPLVKTVSLLFFFLLLSYLLNGGGRIRCKLKEPIELALFVCQLVRTYFTDCLRK